MVGGKEETICTVGLRTNTPRTFICSLLILRHSFKAKNAKDGVFLARARVLAANGGSRVLAAATSDLAALPSHPFSPFNPAHSFHLPQAPRRSKWITFILCTDASVEERDVKHDVQCRSKPSRTCGHRQPQFSLISFSIIYNHLPLAQ